MIDVKHYVGKAEEFQRLSKEVKDRVLKRHYELLADKYRELAQSYSRRKPDGGEPLGPSTSKEDRGASDSH
jgi:hypothetical protein